VVPSFLWHLGGCFKVGRLEAHDTFPAATSCCQRQTPIEVKVLQQFSHDGFLVPSDSVEVFESLPVGMCLGAAICAYFGLFFGLSSERTSTL
jgi:hypothetical protein